MTVAIREAAAAEFAEGRLEDALATYRQALGSAIILGIVRSAPFQMWQKAER